MGRVKVRYYVVRNGRGFWQPKASIRALGFTAVACGEDGPNAWARAEDMNLKVKRVKAGLEPAPALARTMSVEAAEDMRVHPVGSIAEAFARYRRTEEFARKAAATRDEWWRAYRRLRDAGFADCDPRTFDLETLSTLRREIETTVSLREAHRFIKVWRALWKVMAALHYCDRDKDPSLGVRNTAAQGRSQTWSDREVARLVKRAWRMGYRGLAACLAVMWDGTFSPGDARSLLAGQQARSADGRAFFTERAKTGAPVGAVLTRRATRVLDAYAASLGVELTPGAPIFRNRSGAPYLKNALAEDFRDVRTAEFGPEERRQMLDFRRAGAVEAIAGNVDPTKLGRAMGNSIAKSRALQDTYLPNQISNLRDVHEARRRGRQKLALENGK